MKTVYSNTQHAYPIKLDQAENGRFTVTYGLKVRENLSYEAAALELGACIMHAAACDGLLDDE